MAADSQRGSSWQPKKRTQSRFHTRIFCVFKNDLNLDETEVLMLNMGSGGAFINTDSPAPPGTPVTLRMYLKPDSEPLSISAEVVWWRTNAREGTPGMGVKFSRVGKDDLEAIKAFIENLIEDDLFQ